VSEQRTDSVVVSAADGTRTAVPLWMVRAVHRDQIGDWVILVSIRLNTSQALVQAVPGIDIPGQRKIPRERPFTPFGRGDKRIREVSDADAEILRGIPEELTVLIPVTIEE
jgi:hypothetical protein